MQEAIDFATDRSGIIPIDWATFVDNAANLRSYQEFAVLLPTDEEKALRRAAGDQ